MMVHLPFDDLTPGARAIWDSWCRRGREMAERHSAAEKAFNALSLGAQDVWHKWVRIVHAVHSAEMNRGGSGFVPAGGDAETIEFNVAPWCDRASFAAVARTDKIEALCEFVNKPFRIPVFKVDDDGQMIVIGGCDDAQALTTWRIEHPDTHAILAADDVAVCAAVHSDSPLETPDATA